MSRQPAISIILAAGLFRLAATAHAATFCVHDAGELGSALFTAQSNGTGDTIKLARGTYTLTGQVSYYSGDVNLTLSGGWDSSCFLRIADAANTVIDGTYAYNVFTNTNGTLTLDAVNFHRIKFQTMSADAVVVRRDQFTGTQNDDAVQVDSSSGSVLFDSNLFVGKNVTVRSYDGTSSAPPVDWRAINNTFVNAVKAGPASIFREGYGLYLTTPGSGSNVTMVLANNVAWGNSDGGIHIDGAPSVIATHNQWQSFDNENNVALQNGSGSNDTANPQLDAGFHPLAPGSPVINSGTTSFPGGIGTKDVAGGPRKIGSQPDRGAYESAADDAAVITVTTSADSGACPSATTCSLRAALTAAAAAGNAQRIAFNLSSCPQTINVNSALPAIVDNLTLDGYSQPGAVANSLDAGSDARLCVILRGNYASSVGLLANNTNSRLTVRGLAFENFGYAGVWITDGSYHVIEGNQFGGPLAVGASGTQALSANARGIRLSDSTTDVLVGGADAEQRNVIDGATSYGIGIIGNVAGSHTVRNNYIGLAPNGNTAAGNAVGLIVQDYFNVVQDNFISANTNEGLRIETSAGQGTAVFGNHIGVPAQGLASVGNGGPGVRFTGSASNNTIGATFAGLILGNDIVGNGVNGFSGPGTGDGGISLESGTGNRLTGNRIYANYGLGIDLNHDGPTPNDATDADTGANQLQNFPTLLRISHLNGARRVSGSVYTTLSQRIEVFGASTCGDGGRGSAATVLSSGARAILAPLGGGTANFTLDIGRGPGTGVDNYCTLSATATSVDGNTLANNNNTSELSACFVDDTIFAHGFDSAVGWSCAP